MQHFVLFGPMHLATIACLVVLGGILCMIAARRDRATEIARVALGVYMIVQEMFDRSFRVIANGEHVKDALPLNLCGAGVFLVAYVLLRKSYRAYEIMYFWALAGASMAILTPDHDYAVTNPLYITYFVSHACIIYGVLFMGFAYDFRPTWGSFWRTVIYTNVFTLFVFPVNLMLDTNYLYVRHKPDGETLMSVLGPWPWYILALEAVGFCMMAALYLPYAAYDAYLARSSGGSPRKS